LQESDLTKRMRADLLMGEFGHGQWLRLGELEKRYKVSRFEVRKALTALAAIGVAAAVKIYHRAQLADLERLHALARNFQKSVEADSLAATQAANDAFHHAFFALAGNPVLVQMIDEMRELIRPYSVHPYATKRYRQESASEHFTMLDCIESKNLEGLLDVMRSHLYRVTNLTRYR